MFYSVAYYLKSSDQSEFTVYIILMHIPKLLRFYSDIRPRFGCDFSLFYAF